MDTPISAARPGEVPALEIRDVDEPYANWRAEYERPDGDKPAQISINTAFLKDASPQLVQSVIAHELGHANYGQPQHSARTLLCSTPAGSLVDLLGSPSLQ